MIKMTPSCLKSLGEYRSWTLYHFVYGRATPVEKAVAPLKVASEGIVEKEAGDGSGASAKSAKSIIVSKASRNQHLYAPESPAGIGEADGFAPPKRPLNIAAAMTVRLTCAMRKSLTRSERSSRRCGGSNFSVKMTT